MTEPPFKRVLDRLMEIIPHLVQRPGKMVHATTLIQDWLDKGCDVDLDILPVINKKWAKTPCGVSISSAMYFHDPVIKAMQERLQTSEHKTREEELTMKAYAWKRARGLHVLPQKLELLAAYEAKHGPVIIESLPQPA